MYNERWYTWIGNVSDDNILLFTMQSKIRICTSIGRNKKHRNKYKRYYNIVISTWRHCRSHHNNRYGWWTDCMQCPVLTLNRVSAMTRNRYDTRSSAVIFATARSYYIRSINILRIATNREIRYKCRNNITLDSGTSLSARALNYYIVEKLRRGVDMVRRILLYHIIIFTHTINNDKRSPDDDEHSMILCDMWYDLGCLHNLKCACILMCLRIFLRSFIIYIFFFFTCSVGVTLGQRLHRNDQTEITFESWTGFREVATCRKTVIVAESQWKSFVMHAFLFLTTISITFLQYIHIDEQTWNFRENIWKCSRESTSQFYVYQFPAIIMSNKCVYRQTHTRGKHALVFSIRINASFRTYREFWLIVTTHNNCVRAINWLRNHSNIWGRNTSII